MELFISTEQALQQLRIGVIGGSNSALKNGYVPLMVKMLEESGVVVDLENHAVGATNSVNGLAVLKNTELAGNVDILLVEYTLNDAASFSRRPQLFGFWAKAYEGMIRIALDKNPDLIIIPIILKMRTREGAGYLCPVYSGSVGLAARYHLQLVDMVAEEAVSGPDPETLYSDEAHYSINSGAPWIASHVSRVILEVLRQRPCQTVTKPVDPTCFSNVKYWADVSALVPECKTRHFINSMVDVNAYVLANKDPVRFRLWGRILALQFVSTPDSPAIRISVGKESYIQNTVRSTFRNKKFPFLLSTIIPVVHTGVDLTSNGSLVSISHTPPDNKDDSSAGLSEATGAFIPSVEPISGPFHLVGILYSGGIQPM
ncbi:SGNH/GDSL hydrolase family protein [Parathalassolituus penaei]|uniref:SGNH/GDSL hydrolase family protein n=1 Tax=Parathalassolituus penaei TaxID=2997323 RepID=A0A9X3EFE6_9GAMM|nr:SGNH/GDSL hydrolase family protein [Parathalassolituus penaei]MCY0965755.1 SGNH/GDSL hydrolase family protein [Parathalassolituus penaei]